MSDGDRVRLAPIDVPLELKERIKDFARRHGDMSFAAAVRYLLDQALREEEGP